MRKNTNELIADTFVNLLNTMKIGKRFFCGHCNQIPKDCANFELKLQDENGNDTAVFEGTLNHFGNNDLRLDSLYGHWIQYYKGYENDEDAEKINLFFDMDEDYISYKGLVDCVKNHILETKQYRYFCDDYHRLNSKHICSYLWELTKDGLLDWKESIEEDYGEHGCSYLYESENGEESFRLYINHLDDYENYDDEDGYDAHDIFLTIENRLEVKVSNHLELIYDEIINDELEALITNSNNLNPKKIIDVMDVIVRSNNFECIYNNHNLQHVKTRVNVMTHTGIREIEIDAAYCPECDQYYILENTYNRLKAYGRICCQVIEFSVMKKLLKSNGTNWAEKSTLSMYGYSVNAKDNLSESEREEILSFLMENDIVSSYWIASFLGRQIESREDKPNMENAIHKWEHDIGFVENYEYTNDAVRVKKIYVQKKKYY